MPYTPPTQSPAASPAQSRSASISMHERPSTITPGHPPPRSSSYLKLRRSSYSQQSPTGSRTVSESTASQSRSSSLHQSPSPVNQSSYIPTGAIVSPPDSTQNSSDDEGQDALEMHRGRQIDNLDELKEAIKVLPQRRTPSPDNSGKHASLDGHVSSRRHGHNRSTSDSSFLKQFNKSNAESDVEDEGYRIAPPMVRKKSGELVKSSLKTPNRSRPSSVPSTPTFPKAVHFDQHLEHVRHFMHTEKPTAVSAGSSPVESFDDDNEFPFDSEEPSYMSPPFEWEIGLPNFPKDPTARKHLPVRVERVYLSTDKQNLLGCVAVKNISFQKLVVVRFTLDYWQTVSEVTAEFSNDVRKKFREENYDRFIFKVKLQDLANLDTKTLFFCVRYVVNGQELWDNNNHMNYQVDFKKKFLPVNGKAGGVRMSLPRTRPSPTLSRQSSSMQNIDAFDDLDDLSSITTQVDKPVPRSSVTIGEVSEPVRRANAPGNVFSTRYDFTASLSAAISAANTIMGPRSGLSDKSTSVTSQPEDSPYFKFTASPKMETLAQPPLQPSVPVVEVKDKVTVQLPVKAASSEVPANGEKPPIESLSYRELLETYCFFGSARNSPQLNQTQILEDANVTHDEFTHNHPILSAYTLGGAVPGSHSPSPPTSLTGSPVMDIAQSPRYTPPNGSPPSLSGSQRSSASSSPVPFGTYKYQPRRNHGGFVFDTPTHATAIRG